MGPLRFPVVWFFGLTYLLMALGQCAHFMVSQHLSAGVAGGTPIEDTPMMTWARYAPLVTGTGPSVAGLLMTLLLYGPPGLRRLARQFVPWSVGRAWLVLVVCVLLPLVVIVLPLGILATLGISVPRSSWPGPGYVTGVVVGGFLGPGVFEEIGWRGFALPHLQRRYTALASSLIIGVVWAVWHTPNFVMPSEPPPWWYPPAYVLLLAAASVLFTWVYNATGGSLFAVVLLHGAIFSALGLRDTPTARAAAIGDLIALPLFAVVALGLVWRYGAANLSWGESIVTGSPNPAVHLTPAATQGLGTS